MSTGTVSRLIGVYDADGTVRGEVSYAIGHLLGKRTCELCAITHRGVFKRSGFTRLADRLGVPFELIHRDQQGDELRALTEGRLACVVAEIDGELTVFLDKERLAECHGAPDALFAEIENEARRRELQFA